MRPVIRFFSLIVFLCLASSQHHASAAAIGHAITSQNFDKAMTAPFRKIGYGCGWDYPCEPRPYFKRRDPPRTFRSDHSSVHIDHNSGTVNIYTSDKRPRRRDCHDYDCRPRARPCVENPCRPIDWVEPRREVIREPVGRSCSGYQCRDDCGAKCWYGRFKDGYCGHGCDYYRKRVRFEERDKVIKVPHPVSYEQVPVYYKREPVYYREKAEVPAVVEERRIIERPVETAPVEVERPTRQRYIGPQYPPSCSGNNC